jgi:hypothetical protein
MLDDKVVEALEEILDKTRGALSQALTRLREAESEVDKLKREIAALENSAAQTAKAIDGVRLSMTAGRSGGMGSAFRLEEVLPPSTGNGDGTDTRSNVQDIHTRDYRRDNSIAYLNQNRPKLVQQDFEPTSTRFSDRTITQSCTLLLREAGRPLHVNELYNMLVAGGMKFKGNNPTISVAVSLSRNSRFRKVDPGTFDLVIREAYQAAS